METNFWAKVLKTDTCWLWTGASQPDGRGNLGRDGKTLSAPRVSWEMANGEIPEGQDVLHECDTPACVNPEHLFLGTQQDNDDDMRRKGRGYVPKDLQPEGEKHWRATITEGIARQVKALLGGGMRQCHVAGRLAISPNVVKGIAAGRTWKHV